MFAGANFNIGGNLPNRGARRIDAGQEACRLVRAGHAGYKGR
jgi:hypothetical protein